MKKITILITLVVLSFLIVSGCNDSNTEITETNTATNKIAQNELPPHRQGEKTLPPAQKTCTTPEELVAKSLENENIIILDVRTPEEFAEGHISNAINIDYKDASFPSEVSKLDSLKQYLVYCRSGNRSKKSIEIMKEEGIDNTCNLDGGITAWTEKGNIACTDSLTC